MKISPFTPLHFGDANQSDGWQSRHVQIWSQTDQILVQIIATTDENMPAVELKDAHSGTTLSQISCQQWQMNTDKKVYFFTLQGLTVGHYKIYIYDYVGQTLQVTSDEFRVTDDAAALAKTTLIQYRFKDNKQREDVVSIIDLMTYFFDFRVPGGFKDSGWAFGVSNEQFTTQREDLIELFANDYITKTFTLGGALGVPVWYGEMLNRLLTCSYVYIDGERYTRNESEVPATNILVDGMDSFVFTQSLRRVNELEPAADGGNIITLRRVTGNNVRMVDNSNILILEQTQL